MSIRIFQVVLSLTFVTEASDYTWALTSFISASDDSIRVKGGYIAQSKNLKTDFMILSGRVDLDKVVGTGETVKFGLICLPDTKQKSKNRFSQTTYFGQVTGFDEELFVQGGA